jgi:hypothetical protein
MQALMTGELLDRPRDHGVTIGLLISATFHGVIIIIHGGVGLHGSGTAIFGMPFSVHTGHRNLTAIGLIIFIPGALTPVRVKLDHKHFKMDTAPRL